MHLRYYFVPCGKSLVTNVASRFLPSIAMAGVGITSILLVFLAIGSMGIRIRIIINNYIPVHREPHVPGCSGMI
jgi:hypothetical protein